MQPIDCRQSWPSMMRALGRYEMISSRLSSDISSENVSRHRNRHYLIMIRRDMILIDGQIIRKYSAFSGGDHEATSPSRLRRNQVIVDEIISGRYRWAMCNKSRFFQNQRLAGFSLRGKSFRLHRVPHHAGIISNGGNKAISRRPFIKMNIMP